MSFSNTSAVKLSFLALASLLLPVVPMHGQELVWAAHLGGPSVSTEVAVDGDGNVYTTGFFLGTADFDPGAGVFNLTSAGDYDIFVSKVDRSGNFVWARRIGGTGDDLSEGVALDGSGNVYTTGGFSSAVDFDPGAGVFTLAGLYRDIFVSKLDNSGNFVWARRIGGAGYNMAFDVALDGSGNVYTTGFFGNGSATGFPVDFDPGPGVFNLPSPSPGYFISKLDTAGDFIWALPLGGLGNGLALDGDGDVYATGVFIIAADFDPGAGIVNLTPNGGSIFISKFDSAGDFIWARQMGRPDGKDSGTAVAVAADGSVYTTGRNATGGSDAVVSKLDSAGNFVWVREIEGAQGLDVVVEGDDVYTTGYFVDTADFDPGAGVFNLTSAGSGDIFVSKLDSAGSFVKAWRMGGVGPDQGRSVAVDGSGNVYTTGVFSNTVDFDPGAGVFNLTSAGGTNIVVAKYKDQPGTRQPPVIAEGGIVLSTLLPTVSTISPLSIISVFGQNFSTETILFPNLDGAGKIDTILGGACLMMNGEALPIFAITPGQINAQASAGNTLGPASFVVVTNCGTTSPLLSETVTLSGVSPPPRALASNDEMATVEGATPGFFLFPPRSDEGFIAARFNAVPGQPPVPVAPVDSFPDDSFGPSRPAVPGDIILLYGTGWGETEAGLSAGQLATGAARLNPNAYPSVTFGGVVMAGEDVIYVGATPGTAGLYQLAIRVPAIAMPGNNQVVLTVYGKSTPLGPVIPVAAP